MGIKKWLTKLKEKRRKDPILIGGFRVAFIYLLLFIPAVSICILFWGKLAALLMTLIGLSTLLISLLAYFYEFYRDINTPGKWLRVFKSMGDIGASVIVIGTLKATFVTYSLTFQFVFTFIAFLIIILTSFKVAKDI